jgi:hypothetical protein
MTKTATTKVAPTIDHRGPHDQSADLSRRLEARGEADRDHDVYQHLKALPADPLFPLAGRGPATPTGASGEGAAGCSTTWASRRSPSPLETGLVDPDPRVRRAAVHSLACQDCKPGGCVLNVRGRYPRSPR